MSNLPDFTKPVYATTDYTSLNHYSFNRPCNIHGMKLMKKIQQLDLLRSNPLKVRKEADGKLYILDGQGRHFAAMMLKKPVYYELEESTLDARKLIEQYNNNSARFSSTNYVHLFTGVPGSDDYEKLQEVCVKGLNFRFAARMLSANRNLGRRGIHEIVKEGSYKAKSDTSGKLKESLLITAQGTLYYQQLSKKHGIKKPSQLKINEAVFNTVVKNPGVTLEALKANISKTIQNQINSKS